MTETPGGSRRNRRVRRALPFVVTAAALGFLFVQLDPAAALAAADARVVWILLPALLAYGGVSLLLEAASLLCLVPEHAAGFGLASAARVKAASYLVYIVNYMAGTAALTYLLNRRAGVRLSEAAGVVLTVAAFDLGILLAASAAGMATLQAESNAVRGGVVVGVGLAILGGFLLLRLPASLGPLEGLRSHALFLAARTIAPGRLAALLALRVLFVASFVGVVEAALLAFGISVPPGDLILNVVIIVLISSLPIAVAGLGTGQMAFVYCFGRWGDPDTLLACSLVLSAALITLRVAIGLGFAREYAREARLATQESIS